MTGKEGRPRQKRSQVTRDRLIDAGFELFAAGSVGDVTVDDICTAAGVAKGTFYFHFPTKESLLVAGFHRGSDAQLEHARLLAVGGVRFDEAILAFGDRIARNTSSHPKALVRHAAIAALAAIDPVEPPANAPTRRIALELLVSSGMERGELTTDLLPSELAMALNWTMVHSILVWSILPAARPTLRTIMRRRLVLALYGMTDR